MDDSHNSDTTAAIWAGADEVEAVDGSIDPNQGFREGLRDFLYAYWEKRRLALGIVTAGIVLSIGYALSLRNVYTSTTSLMPQNNASPYSSMLSLVSGSDSAAALGGEALGLGTPSDLQVSILGSRAVQDAMIVQFDLMHRYKAHVIEDARAVLTSHTRIDQDRKSGIITIAVTDTSPEFACKLAQGYVAELNQVLTVNSTSAARRERIFLEGRLKEVKRDLDDSSKALSQFSTKSKAIDVPAQARVMVESSMRLQGLLAESEGQLAALKQTYSGDNVRVKALEARNAELRRQLNGMSGVTDRSGGATSADGLPYPSVGDLPLLGLTYADLERKVRVDEALWETLTKQYEIARVQEAKEVPTIQVLDVANVPNRKSAPKRSIIVLITTFLSVILSGIIVFGLNRWKEFSGEGQPRKFFARILSK